MLTDNQRARADRSFKQQQKEIQASQAWRDLAAEQAATTAKTARLRALRLERDAQKKEPAGTNRSKAS